MARAKLSLAVLLAGCCFAQKIAPLTETAEFISSPALSPDGRTLAFVNNSMVLVLRSLDSHATVDFAGRDRKEGSPDHVAWSPDGQRIAFTRWYCHHCPHSLFLKNATGGDEIPLGTVSDAEPSWTPDGRYLITAAPVGDEEDSQLVLIPADGGARIVLMANEGNVAAVAPDGKRLVYAAGNVLKLAQITSDFRLAGAPVAIAREPHAISSIHWAPDGSAAVYQVWNGATYTRLLPMGGPIFASTLLDAGANIDITQILADGSALGAEDLSGGALWRLDLNTQASEKVRDIAWTDSSLAVSPDGQFVAFVTERNGPSQIWISKLDGSNPRVLVSAIPSYGNYGDNTMAGGLSWSPDAQWIAFQTVPGVGGGDPEARLFLIPSAGGPLRTLVESCAVDYRAVPWAPDSKSVFIVRYDDDLNESYFRVDILSGQQTSVSETSLPPRPQKLAPAGGQNAHLVQDGRYLYYEKRGDLRSRIVVVHGLLGGQ